MVRYNNARNHQPLAGHMRVIEGQAQVAAAVHTCTSQQLVDGIYKHLAAQGFFRRHVVHRVTLRQFLDMLASHVHRAAA